MERISNESSSFIRYGGIVMFIQNWVFLYYYFMNYVANVVNICGNYFTFTLDQRVINWPLMETPLPLACIIAVYLMVIYRWGPT